MRQSASAPSVLGFTPWAFHVSARPLVMMVLLRWSICTVLEILSFGRMTSG